MSTTTNAPERTALRGSILHFIDDPTDAGNADAYEFFEDGLLVIEDGYISKVGDRH